MPRGREHRLPIRRFEQECQFLYTIRHPNVIQYLGMYTDPDTGLPVLLMELMDDSLTHFLEAATQQIPYHIQVNICHDITMALTFLHVNGIVHRDLSSNNVLLTGNGVRAKVTDFGMAKLGDINPRASRLTFTMCPGTDVYMPPEAVEDQPVYNEKMDCFSFGVIVVQILTRQFPKPDDRMQRVEINHPGLPRGTLKVCIPEVDRRQNHISRVDPNHTLLPISLECLKDRDVERPSAQQLSERVKALKEQSKYTESARIFEARERNFQEQIQSLNERLRDSNETISTRDAAIAARDEVIFAKEHEIQDLIRSHDEAIQARDREIRQLREQLQQVTSEMNQRGQRMRETLKPSIENEMQKISISGRQECVLPTDIKLRWRRGKPAPEAMSRWCDAAVGDGEVYFNIGSKKTIYSYNINSDQWSQLPDCPYMYSYCSIAVIDNLLTAIGGYFRQKNDYSNKLYSLKQQTQRLQWVEEFPPMPTKRCSPASICTKTDLIVAGGGSCGTDLACVEVMNRNTRQWSIAANMPCGMSRTSGVICGDHLYIGGGDYYSVHSCLLSDLLQSCQSVSPIAQQRSLNTHSVWNRTKTSNLPEDIELNSTLLSLCGHLLAIGGTTDINALVGGTPSGTVYIYKTETNSWEVISRMLVARCDCYAVTLPTNKVMVVGGVIDSGKETKAVEFADLVL